MAEFKFTPKQWVLARDEELWKDVVGYEGYYIVSSLGRVKRINTPKGDYELKTFIVGKYLSVGLCVNNKKVQRRVHRLVAEAFIPNKNKLSMINHKDENKMNNKVSNLEWCNAKYNCNYGSGILKCSEKRKNNIEHSKIVLKCDKSWNVVERFPSIKECERHGYNKQIVSQLCNNKHGCRYNSHKGYYWKFE